jgi:hypothetical protein
LAVTGRAKKGQVHQFLVVAQIFINSTKRPDKRLQSYSMMRPDAGGH